MIICVCTCVDLGVCIEKLNSTVITTSKCKVFLDCFFKKYDFWLRGHFILFLSKVIQLLNTEHPYMHVLSRARARERDTSQQNAQTITHYTHTIGTKENGEGKEKEDCNIPF